MTQQESEFFYDIARGSQSAILEFLFIRNKLLATWLADPTQELTANKAQSTVLLPQAGTYNSGEGVGIVKVTHPLLRWIFVLCRKG